MIENEAAIFQIERPHPRLMTLYLIRSLLTGPGLLITLPLLYFRYHTLRYRFDAEGVSMSWGLLFRHETNLTYSRIQDIHVTSGIIQRWLGLADLQIQTASGSASAEMTIEGLPEFAAVRDFLYARMRGYKDRQQTDVPATARTEGAGVDVDAVAALQGILAELRGARQALERLAQKQG